jgi:hypothetical protein
MPKISFFPSSGVSGSVVTILNFKRKSEITRVFFDNKLISTKQLDHGVVSIIIPPLATVGNHFVTVFSRKRKNCCETKQEQEEKDKILFNVTNNGVTATRIINLADFNFSPFIVSVPDVSVTVNESGFILVGRNVSLISALSITEISVSMTGDVSALSAPISPPIRVIDDQSISAAISLTRGQTYTIHYTRNGIPASFTFTA